MDTINPRARRNSDGLAILGRTRHALMGIRYAEGEDVDPDANPVVEPEETGPDLATLEAKIADLTSQLEAANATIAEKEAAIIATKAMNYDLLMATSKDENPDNPEPEIDDGEDPDVGDFFGSDDDKDEK